MSQCGNLHVLAEKEKHHDRKKAGAPRKEKRRRLHRRDQDVNTSRVDRMAETPRRGARDVDVGTDGTWRQGVVMRAYGTEDPDGMVRSWDLRLKPADFQERFSLLFE